MTDFSSFPFDEYTTNELGQLFIQAVRFGDTDFANALREKLKGKKDIPSLFNASDTPQTVFHCAMCETPAPEDRIAVGVCSIHGRVAGWMETK